MARIRTIRKRFKRYESNRFNFMTCKIGYAIADSLNFFWQTSARKVPVKIFSFDWIYL